MQDPSSTTTVAIPAMPIELCIVMNQICSVAKAAMVDLPQDYCETSDRSSIISRSAHRIFKEIGMRSQQQWSFCDLLFIRMFQKLDKKYMAGRCFVLHVACFLSYLSMCPADELVRTIVDIYEEDVDECPSSSHDDSNSDSDKNKKSVEALNDKSRSADGMMTLKACKAILLDVLPQQNNKQMSSSSSATSSDLNVTEKIDRLLEYCAATSVRFESPATRDSLDELTKIPVKSFVHFCTKLHPSVMWPATMMQKQLQTRFLGKAFWLQQASSSFFQFLQASQTRRSVFWFLEVMSKVHHISNKKLIDDDNNNNDNRKDVEIIETLVETKNKLLFSHSMFSVSTSIRTVRGEEGVWKERREPAIRWSPRPTLAYDLFYYSGAQAKTSHAYWFQLTK